ncbi:MAG TPA: XkdF-like putative serine protease domain-containing protein [Stellaceae bacterium]|nr:XkdF-like putative serine protease domain-containing protein [Stellaceae bacterium]
MRIFVPLAKFDEEQRLAIGYASTPALDSQGEIVKREAVEAALPDYMRFANIREMHQPSAVGVAQQADLDARGLRIAAKVVDDDAWEKVKQGVYKGFSIGGRVTSRDPDDQRVITGLDLTEISLVDRPANPEAVIDVYKVFDLAKEGRRNNAADQKRIQHVHDTAVELGASCAQAPAETEPDADDPAKAARGDLAKHASLAERLDALAREVAAQRTLLTKLAAEPAPPKYQSAARAVDKSEDGVAKRADDEPATALDAIRKAHRNPIRLGFF